MAKINLMYHDVYIRDVNESGFNRERDLMYKMDVVTFESHVKNIHNLCRQKSLPLENIVFTFDDGGKSFLDVIAPILDKYGFKSNSVMALDFVFFVAIRAGLCNISIICFLISQAEKQSEKMAIR